MSPNIEFICRTYDCDYQVKGKKKRPNDLQNHVHVHNVQCSFFVKFAQIHAIAIQRIYCIL